MAKTKVEKEAMLAKLDYVLSEAKGAVLVDYQGLTVKATEDLRSKLTAEKSNLVVAKNRLLQRVLDKHEITAPDDVLTHPLAVLFSPTDEVAPAKAATAFAKENEAFEILGGVMDGKFMTIAQIKVLAALPSLPEMRGMLVGTLAAPMTQLAGVLKNSASGIVNVLAAYQRKLEEV